MGKILLLIQDLSPDSEAMKYAASIAKASGAQVECLCLTSASPSTAEWIHSRPPGAIQRLRRSRARQTTAEWIQTLESARSEERADVQRQKNALRENFEKLGIVCSCRDLRFDSGAFLKTLKEFMPVELIIAGKLRYPAELTQRGIMTAVFLGQHFGCKAIDVDMMEHSIRPVPQTVWWQLAAYGAATAFVYFIFFPQISSLNGFFMRGGVVPAIAIMGTVAAVAWVYGKSVECLLKLAKLDIY